MDKIDLVKIIQNGGATLDDSGRPVSFKRGYQVSKKDCYILNARHTNKILKAVNGILNGLKPGEFCGLWVDGGRGVWQIDYSTAQNTFCGRLIVHAAGLTKRGRFHVMDAAAVNRLLGGEIVRAPETV